MAKHQFKRIDLFQDNQDALMHNLLANQASVTEQNTVPLVALHGSPSTVPQKVEGNSSTAVQRMIATGFARLQEPQPEGLFTRGLKAAEPGKSRLGLLPVLTLTNALGLLIVSFSFYVSVLQHVDPAF